MWRSRARRFRPHQHGAAAGKIPNTRAATANLYIPFASLIALVNSGTISNKSPTTP